MRKLLNWLNPITMFTTLFGIIKELIEYRKYANAIERMDKEKILEDNGFDRGPLYSIIRGVNLRPEVLLYGEGDQEQFELGFVANEMKKYNELLAKEGILNLVTTHTKRIQNHDYYGYVVSIVYNFKKLKTRSIAYCISYITVLTILLFKLNYSAIYYFVSNLVT